MKRLIIGLALLVLVACQPPTVNPIGETQLYQVHLSYATLFLAPATNYRRLGLCPGESRATLQNVCAEREVVRKLQSAQRSIKIAITNLEAFALANPNVDPGTYISAAMTAINTGVAILAEARRQ